MNLPDRLIAAGSLGLALTLGASSATSSPAVYELDIECRVSTNNDGCQTTVACPQGTKIRSARAACNLEYGPVSDENVSSVEEGMLKVVRPSDHVDEGQCWIGTNQVTSGEVAVSEIAALPSVTVGCQEHDKNGGDCHIRGTLYCEQVSQDRDHYRR